MLETLPSTLGEALKGVRPGLEKLASARDFADVPETVAVESSAFRHQGAIPAIHTDDGRKLSPPLTWQNIPVGTVAVALLIEDADSPTPEPLVHAIALGLPPEGALVKGELKSPGSPGKPHLLGKNSFLKPEYLPPDPPSGHGPHRYAFQVFALDRQPTLDPEPGRSAFVAALKGHVLARGILIGTYERR